MIDMYIYIYIYNVGPPRLQSWCVTTVSLWFMVVIIKARWGYKPAWLQEKKPGLINRHSCRIEDLPWFPVSCFQGS